MIAARTLAVRSAKRANARQDLIGGLGSDERFWIRVMCIDEVADRRFKFADAAMRAAPQLLGRELGKPALDQVQPGPMSRREVDVKARRLANQFRISGVVWEPRGDA